MVASLRRLSRIPLLAALAFASGHAYAADNAAATDIAFPRKDEIFVVAFGPQARGVMPYFDERLFMALYPSLRPAHVKISVGARRIWQRGVIVTRDKKVLFWSTCAGTFIAVETGEGQRFFAREAEVFVQ